MRFPAGRFRHIWIGLHLLAAAVPFLSFGGHVPGGMKSFDGWPGEFDGRTLDRLELTEREKRYSRGFPGYVARFTDGTHEIVIRWLERETRRLHPIADCLKGDGYSVRPRPVRVDMKGNRWGCVEAVRNGQMLDVCEIVFDGAGNSWSDISSWYWAAILQRTNGPYWAITVAKEKDRGEGW